MKTAKVTTAYCRDLLDRHYCATPTDQCCSDEIDAALVKKVLREADRDSRFKVSWDPSDPDNEEDDQTWDVIGPAVPYGHVYFDTREMAEEARDALNSILREHFGPCERRPELLPDAHRNRVYLEGPCCPACGSKKVGTNETRHKGSVYTIMKDCLSCNAEWTETYGYQGYQDLRID